MPSSLILKIQRCFQGSISNLHTKMAQKEFAHNQLLKVVSNLGTDFFTNLDQHRNTIVKIK